MQHQANKSYTRDDILTWSVEYFVTLPLAAQEIQRVIASFEEHNKQYQQDIYHCEQQKAEIASELALIQSAYLYRDLPNKIGEAQKQVARLREEVEVLEKQSQLCSLKLTYIEKKALYIEANTIVTNLSHEIESTNARILLLDDEVDRLTQYKKSYQTQATKIENMIESTQLMIDEWQEKSPSAEQKIKISQLQQMLATFHEGAASIYQKREPVLLELEEKKQLVEQLEARVQQCKAEAEQVSQRALEAFMPLQHKFPGVSSLFDKDQLLKQKTEIGNQLCAASDSFAVSTSQFTVMQQQLSELKLLPVGKYLNMSEDEINRVAAELTQSAQVIEAGVVKIHEMQQKNIASIQDLNNQIRENITRKNELSAKKFLMDLFDRPRQMLADCMQLIAKEIQDYEWKHPANQHESVRVALNQFSVIEKEIKALNDNTNDLDLFINHYIILIGWLNDACDRSDQHDVLFVAKLKKILCEHPVDRNESLQDFAKFHDKFKDNFSFNEKAIYELRLNELRAKISDTLQQENITSEARQLYRAAEKVVSEISAYIASQPNKVRDLKYYTTMLSACAKVLDNPLSVAAIQEFKHYADYNVIGNASERLQIRGAFMVFVSAAIAFASFTFGLLSLGLMAPIAIAGFSVSAALLTLGTGSMIYGRQKGIDRSLTLFYGCANHTIEHAIKFRSPALSF